MDKRVVISFFVALAFVGEAAHSQLPDWAMTGRSNRYPLELYWVGVGSGMGTGGLEAAKSQARVAIASQIKVAVSSRMKYVQSEAIVGDVSNYSTDITSETQSVVEKMEFADLTFPETYVNPVDTKAYAFAVLEKEQFFERLRREIDLPAKELEQKLEHAREQASAADLGEAVNTFASIMGDVPDLYPKIFFYNSIAPEAYVLRSELVYDNLEAELGKILGNVSLSIEGGNNQTVALGKAFPQPLAVRATTVIDGKPTLLQRLTISYRTGESEKETAVTNDQGIASISPIASPDLTSDGSSGKLTAYVDIPRMSPRLKAKVERNTSVAFAFTASGAQFTVKVTVAGAGPDAAQFDLVNRVIKELEKNNVRANQQQSRYELHLVITSSEGQTVAGMGGNLYTQKVQVSGMLKDGSTGTIVGTLTASAVGMDKDKTRAVEKGIAGLQFSSKDLSSIIARARE
jgi:hypothetical protein